MTDRTLILWPMAAMALLTFIVLLSMPVFRFRAVLSGKASPGDFRYGESERVPAATRLINRNYMNLLELPVLFYVICLIIYVSGTFNAITLDLAWAFVAFRVLHTLVHVTINRVVTRLVLFAGAAISLAAMWIVTFCHLAAR